MARLTGLAIGELPHKHNGARAFTALFDGIG